jgi:glycosyltransferase involved in cell wall biosynthesis
MALIRESLDQFQNSLIVWADIDIIFFKSFAHELKEFMDRGGYDIAFQKEGFGKWDGEVNTGFIAMRCNDRVRSFYDKVRDELVQNPEKNEQPVVNDLLNSESNLKWTMLPLEYTARSHGWPPQDNMILYHANVTVGKGGVGMKMGQFQETLQLTGKKRRRLCVVSPEVIGPRRNSGIGTHTQHLLKLLARQEDYSVTLLLSSELKVEKDGGWENWFRDNLNVEFVHLEPLPHLYPLVGWFNNWYNLRSMQVYNYLRRENFEIVHFQDLNADGFICHQARKTGQAFQKAVFTTMINGPAKWAREGMKSFPGNEVYESLLNFMESYPLKESDLVLAPSDYAFDYVEKESEWLLGGERRKVPYMLDLPEKIKDQSSFEDPAIIFFGRLETRKGIHLFLEAMDRLNHEDANEVPKKVIFIGNHSDTQRGPSEKVIPEYFATNLPEWEYEIHCDWDQPECVRFLAGHQDSVVVLPSVSETLGYVAIECLGLGLNVIGSQLGAFSEIFADNERLFELHPRAIAIKVKEAFQRQLPPPKSLYNRSLANRSWQNVHDEASKLANGKINLLSSSFSFQPFVSICIPYFNYGKYIRQQVESIARQTYTHFEAIILNDGSNEDESVQVFNELIQDYSGDKRFRFIDQRNMGLSKTRNKAASLAAGDYLVFCDADNISKPHMLEVFVHAMRNSGADCITSHFEKFRIGPEDTRIQLDYYTPVGACIEAGPYVDPFGDANCMIKKEVFESLGGFRHVPYTASEDWEFFAELCLAGYSLEVVPRDLFEYREHPESNMRTTNFYDTRMRTIEPYLKRMTLWQKNLLVNSMGAWEVKMWREGETWRELESLRTEIHEAREGRSESELSLECQKTQNSKLRALNESLEAKILEESGIRESLVCELDLEKAKTQKLESELKELENNFLKRIFYRK